jgi:hypothetical protein
MKNLKLLVAITAACSALISGLQAAPITYTITNNVALQNGHTLTGSITTDGFIGELSPENVTSSTWVVTNTATSAVAWSGSSFMVFTGGIQASATQLTVPTVNASSSFQQNHLSLHAVSGILKWERFGTNADFFESYVASKSVGGHPWDNQTHNSAIALTSTAGGDWIIASVSTVPEPSTYGLLFGGFTLAVVAMRRRTSKQA